MERTLRFKRPGAEVLLDILNTQNNTAFTLEQIAFGEPVALDETLTQIDVMDVNDLAVPLVTLTYHRLKLDTFFANQPLVVDVDTVSTSGLLAALLEQCHVLFEADRITITDPSLGELTLNTELNGFGTVGGGVSSPVGIWYTLTAKDNYLWVGSTRLWARRIQKLMNISIKQNLFVREYFGETNAPKLAIELHPHRRTDPSPYHTKFATYRQNDVIGADAQLAQIAKLLTGDDWVCQDASVDFNLFGSTVLYRGPNTGTFYSGNPRWSHVLVLQLGERCANLHGTWVIEYTDPKVDRYLNYRIDNGPLLDQ